jgi:hypothetical protein
MAYISGRVIVNMMPCGQKVLSLRCSANDIGTISIETLMFRYIKISINTHCQNICKCILNWVCRQGGSFILSFHSQTNLKEVLVAYMVEFFVAWGSQVVCRELNREDVFLECTSAREVLQEDVRFVVKKYKHISTYGFQWAITHIVL